MNAEEYERMYRLEDSYWWFVGRHDLVLGFIDSIYKDRKDLAVLDIGCGTGAMSEKMAGRGTIVSADFSPLALSFGKRRDLKYPCGSDAMRLPFRDASFDLVVAMDTLEHLPDDACALHEIHRVLKPGGRVIATVPAYQSLWSDHDVALMHFRRYAARQLRRRFTDSGLRVTRLSYAMTFLFPIVWLYRRLIARKTESPKASLVPVPALVNRLLVALLSLENRLLHWMSLPFGVTVLCIAERP
jgi:SAM-dependent methyltransferase